jgi:hypothetical protein
VPLLIVILGFPLWRGLRTRTAAAAGFGGAPDAAFLGTSILIGLGITWLLVPLIGATVFRIRYLYPALFIVPIWCFVLVERGRPSGRALRIFAAVLLLLALAVPAERLLADWIYEGPDDCWPCKIRTPFQDIAAELRAAGYDGGGTILADSMSSGGNLRVQFPDARVITPPFPMESWPPAEGHGPCLIVWPTGERITPLPADQLAYFVDAVAGEPDRPHRDGVVAAPYFWSDESVYRMAYRLYPDSSGNCR